MIGTEETKVNDAPPQGASIPVTAAVEDDGVPRAASADALSATSVPPEPPTPMQPRGLALTILATIAFIFMLKWAKDFIIPLVFGIFISYTLNPVVVWLERLRIPRIVGTTAIMLGLIASGILITISVYGQAQDIVDELPFTTYKLTSAMKRFSGGELSPLEKIQSAADDLKKATRTENEPPAAIVGAGGTAEKTAGTPPPTVIIKEPDFKLSDWLWAGSLGLATFLGQAIMVLLLVFFLLASGNTFKRKLVKLTGPSLSNKKITVHILDDINLSIQKYMFMLLVTNLLVTFLMWAVLYWIGLDNSGAWAVAVGLLHVIPYFGTIISVLITGLAAFFQFESFSMMLLVAAATAIIATIVGMMIATWMTGRIAKMNATAVFVALLFGGWLWGFWGLMLCVPMIVVLRVISGRVEEMQSIAEWLGE